MSNKKPVKAFSFLLSLGILSAYPLLTSAASIKEDGQFSVTFRNNAIGGTIDGTDSPKTVYFDFESDNEEIKLSELVGENIHSLYSYRELLGWRTEGSDPDTTPVLSIKKSDFSDADTITLNPVYSLEYPHNSGKLYIQLNFAAGVPEDSSAFPDGSIYTDSTGDTTAVIELSADGFDGYTLPAARLEGAEFAGWYKGNYSSHSSGYSSRKFITEITSDEITEERLTGDVISVTAAYRKKAADSDTKYLFTLDANGGSIDGKEKETYVRSVGEASIHPQVLDIFIPVREGFDFTGWNTDQDGTGITLTHTGFPGETRERVGDAYDIFLEKGDDGPIVLYAVWQKHHANGDVNGDNSTDIADALMVARYDAGLTDLNEEQLKAGNVNHDEITDIADALMIARYDAGLISEFS